MTAEDPHKQEIRRKIEALANLQGPLSVQGVKGAVDNIKGRARYLHVRCDAASLAAAAQKAHKFSLDTTLERLETETYYGCFRTLGMRKDDLYTQAVLAGETTDGKISQAYKDRIDAAIAGVKRFDPTDLPASPSRRASPRPSYPTLAVDNL